MTSALPFHPVVGRLSPRKVRIEGPNGRVLVVDDNEHGARATDARLDADGFDVKVALGGVQALEILGEWMPHIVLLDINMPEFDGFAVASMIRKIGAISHLGIIAMTGFDENELRSRGSLSVFDGYFRRGERDDHLTALIEDMLIRSC